MYIGVYFEVSHRIVVYRHVSVCILKYHIVLSCIGLDTGIACVPPRRTVSLEGPGRSQLTVGTSSVLS